MGRLRLAYKHKDCPDRATRPAPPHWLRKGRVLEYSEGIKTSYTYWTKLYWATPPWLTDEMIADIAEIYEASCSTIHIDHIVPLKSDLVCGLHVPWNLQRMEAKENLTKSNNYWPDCPYQQEELF